MTAILEKLRLEISDFLKFSPSYDDANGFNLQRWINFYHGNLSAMVPKLQNHLVNRKLLNLDDPDLPRKWSRDEFAFVRERRPYEPLLEIDDAFDREGNLISFSRIDPVIGPQAFRHFSTRESLQYCLTGQEFRLRRIQALERVTARMTTYTHVQDIADWSLKTFVEMACYLPLLVREGEANYPYTVAKMIIINAPASVHAIFRLLSPVLPKNTTLHVIGKASPEPLLKLVSSESLPPCYYGTRQDFERTYEESTALPTRSEAAKDVDGICLSNAEMCTVRVRAHDRVQIRIETKSDSQTIRWWFNAKGGPIDFAIYKGDRMELRDLAVPKFSIDTHYIADAGEQLLEEAGVYTVVFQNSWNYFTAVCVDYKLKIC